MPDRKRPARQPVFQKRTRSLIVFVTVCTFHRKRILACDDAHALLVNSWLAAEDWIVGRYVVMPDHLHLFCAPGGVEYGSVKRWIGCWKSVVSRKWPRSHEQPIWQIDAWDTQLRQGQSYSAKWEYVRNNPVRHGLVEDAEKWPFQGEIRRLFWLD